MGFFLKDLLSMSCSTMSDIFKCVSVFIVVYLQHLDHKMESLNTLVGLITCRALTQEESTKMTEAMLEVRDLMAFAIAEKERRERERQNEMMLPPWNR